MTWHLFLVWKCNGNYTTLGKLINKIFAGKFAVICFGADKPRFYVYFNFTCVTWCSSYIYVICIALYRNYMQFTIFQLRFSFEFCTLLTYGKYKLLWSLQQVFSPLQKFCSEIATVMEAGLSHYILIIRGWR